jgi:hypothetical protein
MMTCFFLFDLPKRCPTCGYALAGTELMCPNCGRCVVCG